MIRPVIVLAGFALLYAALAFAAPPKIPSRPEDVPLKIPPPPMSTQENLIISKWDGHMVQLDKLALDEAYKDTLNHLFQIWMRDPTDQPRRAITGAQNARRAYIGVMQEIEKREQRPDASRQ